MKRILLLAALLGGTGYAQDIVGDWKGTISTKELEVRLALHITKGEKSGFKATMDSIDQGASGIAIGSITLTGDRLKFTVEAAQGKYEGKVSGTAIDGLWTQGGMPYPLKFERGAFKPVEHKPAKPTDIDGAWSGNLGAEIVTFHILNTADGLTATLQNASKTIPVTSVTRKGTAIRMEIKAIGAAFDGEVRLDSKAIIGHFTQAGNTIPLALQR